MKKYYVVICFLFIALLSAQSGYVKTPEQLYRSIDNKKPSGEELFSKQQQPKVVDLSDKFPKPGYQGNVGSCAAWAVGYACKSYQENVEHQRDPGKKGNQFSPSFIYNMINKGENKGSTFPEVFNLVKDLGCASMNTMPYTSDYLRKPDAYAFTEAKKYKILGYKRLENGPGLIPAIESSLVKGQPVIIALRVYENFKKLKNDIYDTCTGTKMGGHGMCIIGYDNNNQTFKLINSWGRHWGEEGYCRISYDLAEELFMEAYVCEDIIDKKEDEFILAIPRVVQASEGAFEESIKITWDVVKGAEKYEIYRSNNKNEVLEKLKIIPQNTFRDMEVLDKVKYIYAVKALGKGQTSDLSEITCGWASKEELGIPGNLSLKVFENAIQLNWSKVNKADMYNIYRMKETDVNYHLIGQSKDERFTDSDLPKIQEDLSLYYLVTALRDREESSYSHMQSAKLFAAKSKNIIPNIKKDLVKKVLPTEHEDIIIPKNKGKELSKAKEHVDFYDTSYTKEFFEVARKAEAEAFKKMKQEEENYFDEYKKYEEKMYEKYK